MGADSFENDELTMVLKECSVISGDIDTVEALVRTAERMVEKEWMELIFHKKTHSMFECVFYAHW